MTSFADIPRTLARLEQRRLYRRRRIVDGAQGPLLQVDGRELLNFCSNDYLGLAADPRLAEAFMAGARRWGVGSGASPLVCGYTRAHAELEEALASFTGRPRALLFSSGYAANVATLHALAGTGDLVWQDRLNHASLLDGGRLSGASVRWFGHADMADLARQLAGAGDGTVRRLVVSDGTFSMDGDLCPLDPLVTLAARYHAWLMIDDAHGLGVHGPSGCGVIDPARHGVEQVPVLVGTLGKAFGASGAFVAGSEALVEFLVQRARHYIYSTAPPAAVAVAALCSLAIVREEAWRRERLVALVARFRAGAAALGLPLLPSATPIQPLLLGESATALAWSAALEQRGLLVTAIRPPTVPAGSARLRITLTAAHTEAQVDRLLAALGEVQAGQAMVATT
jgi:8-amino-7-oxononanoate synthase